MEGALLWFAVAAEQRKVYSICSTHLKLEERKLTSAQTVGMWWNGCNQMHPVARWNYMKFTCFNFKSERKIQLLNSFHGKALISRRKTECRKVILGSSPASKKTCSVIYKNRAGAFLSDTIYHLLFLSLPQLLT